MVVSGRVTPGARSTPAALEAIDATVDGRCACGCGAVLDPGAPSAWFASPVCQQRFHARGATRPAEVYARPDAAAVYEGCDAWPVPLSEPGQPEFGPADAQRLVGGLAALGGILASAAPAIQRVAEHLATAARPPVSRLPVPPTPTTYDRAAWDHLSMERPWRLALRTVVPARWCESCRTYTRPREVPETYDGEHRLLRDMYQICRSCSVRLPGPPLLAQWREDDQRGWLALRLSAPGWGGATYRIHSGEAEQFPESVELSWRSMERSLLDAIVFRFGCTVDSCDEIGRSFFRARREFAFLPGRPDGAAITFARTAGDFWLCPAHEYDLRRAVDPATGVPLLDEPRLMRATVEVHD